MVMCVGVFEKKLFPFSRPAILVEDQFHQRLSTEVIPLIEISNGLLQDQRWIIAQTGLLKAAPAGI